MLADLVLVVHAAFVAFVVFGFLAIWFGALLRWRWIGNRRFRFAHLAAIVFVAAEAVAGVACPLTVLEDRLRGAGGGTTFVERHLGALLFYDFPPWVFTAAYLVFALAVIVTLRLVPLRPGRRGTA